MKSETITARARNNRRKHARELLDEHTNSWDGSSDLDELAGSKYAVVWTAGGDSGSWVLCAADAHDLAAHYLDAASGSDGPDQEWIEVVIDLDTGEHVPLKHTLTVTITMPDGVQVTRSLPDAPDDPLASLQPGETPEADEAAEGRTLR